MKISRIVDLSQRLDSRTPTYPGYRCVEVELLETTRIGQVAGRRALNSSRVAFGLHCGTHMDAPFHFYEDGQSIDQVTLERCVGPAIAIDLRAASRASTIEVQDLEKWGETLRETHKVILNLGWSGRWGNPEYFTDHPVLTGDAAQFLVECGVHLVGIDAPSVDRAPFPAHLALLGGGAVIVENLTNLGSIKTELFTLVVLPLALTAREASPVRAIAVEE